MKKPLQAAALLLLLSTLNSPLSTARAQGTAFTYQGRLFNGTNATTGAYDLRFALFDTLTNGTGTQQGNALTNSTTVVSNGLFTVTLDFSNQFPGAARWLEIAVRTNGAATFFTLTPRQPLTPAPYAIFAASANATNLAGTIAAASLPNGLGGVGNTASVGNNATVVGGESNTANGGDAVVTGGNSNTAGGGGATVAGGEFNTANGNLGMVAGGAGNNAGGSFSFAAGHNAQATNDGSFVWADSQFGNFYSISNDSFNVRAGGGVRFVTSGAGMSVDGNFTAGYAGNSISSGVVNGFIGGGGDAVDGPNVVAGNYAAALGGAGNSASGIYSTVMGAHSTASGNYSIAEGGTANASGPFSTAMGNFVTASGRSSFAVGGGNTASGGWSTAMGGGTIASGSYSMAAGFSANATNDGAFVWGDSQNAPFASTNNDSFNVRAQGGVRFVTSGAGLTVDGKVGIGTNNPTENLTIANVTNFNSGLRLTGTNTGAIGMALENTSTGGHKFDLITTGTNSLAGAGAFVVFDETLHTNRMTVNSNGFVGINTATPVTTLQVNGTVTATAFSGDGGGLTNFDASQLSSIGNGNSGSIGNFFVGNSGNATMTGSDNTADGAGAFALNSSGSYNTALGLDALLHNTSGSFNTAVGFDALNFNSAGTNNIALGFRAGFNLSSGNNNIYIGSFGLSTESNTIRIGSGQSATLLAGNVGIGTPSPGAVLDANITSAAGSGSLIAQFGSPAGPRIQFYDDSPTFGLGPKINFNDTNPAEITGNGNIALMPGGNVGIGTTTPVKALEVAGSAAAVGSGASIDPSVLLRLDNLTTNGTTSSPNFAGIGFGNTSTRQAIVGGTFGNDYLDFYTGGLLTAPKMRIDFSGKVGIGTNAPSQALHVIGNILASGTITGSSDRNVKTNFASVNPRDVLDKVAGLPITRWNYDADLGVAHIGPMAQDFYAAFNVGMDDKHISMVDADGVALAAIQGLNEKLEAENAELKARLEKLEHLMAEKTGVVR